MSESARGPDGACCGVGARIDVSPAALYWDAPEPVQGDVQLVGVVRRNTVDAPAGFPVSRGTVRRVRMERRDFGQTTPRTWEPVNAKAGYEDVAASYLPVNDLRPETSIVTTWTGVLLDVEMVGTA